MSTRKIRYLKRKLRRAELELKVASTPPNYSDVVRVLEGIWHAPEDHYDPESFSFQLSIETEYDETGEIVEDVVDDLNTGWLPGGWEASWLGDGGGDDEDLVVEYTLWS